MTNFPYASCDFCFKAIYKKINPDSERQKPLNACSSLVRNFFLHRSGGLHMCFIDFSFFHRVFLSLCSPTSSLLFITSFDVIFSLFYWSREFRASDRDLSLFSVQSLRRMTLNEIVGFRRQEPGFATKAIHAGQKPELWKCRLVQFVSGLRLCSLLWLFLDLSFHQFTCQRHTSDRA